MKPLLNVSPIEVDLKQMNYVEFKVFMRNLAELYSNVGDDAWVELFTTLSMLAKQVATQLDSLVFNKELQVRNNPFIYYGAYEIADKQVVLAVFSAEFSEEKTDARGRPYNELTTSVSFAEDGKFMRCPYTLRDKLTQQDYIIASEKAYPRATQEREKYIWKAENSYGVHF